MRVRPVPAPLRGLFPRAVARSADQEILQDELAIHRREGMFADPAIDQSIWSRRQLSRARPYSLTRIRGTQTQSDGCQSLIHALAITEAIEKIDPQMG
jgi:hypothetical protein